MYFSITKIRNFQAGVTNDWHSMDNAVAYKKLKSGITNYKPKDFVYRYNDHGFRSDEFSEKSDIPIIFIGCSHTEGLGLPIEDTWGYLLITKIRQKTGMNIPFWNLGYSGASLDLIAEILFWYSEILDQKPHYVFALFPDIHRRMSSYQRRFPISWLSSHGVSNIEEEVFLDDDFATYQSFRSLMVVELFRRLWGAELVGCSHMNAWEHNYRQHFPNFKMVDFPDLKYNTSYARDGVHYGPEMHAEIARRYWEVVEGML